MRLPLLPMILVVYLLEVIDLITVQLLIQLIMLRLQLQGTQQILEIYFLLKEQMQVVLILLVQFLLEVHIPQLLMSYNMSRLQQQAMPQTLVI